MNTKQRCELVARAHHLKPVVIISHKGLVDTVLAEIDKALSAHELIKVKINALDKTERLAIATSIASSLDAIHLKLIGNIAIFFRENPSEQE